MDTDSDISEELIPEEWNYEDTTEEIEMKNKRIQAEANALCNKYSDGIDDLSVNIDELIDQQRDMQIRRKESINTLLQLEKIKPELGQEWCVLAYFLTDEISSTGCHGMWIHLGSYPNKKKGKKRIEKIIQKTGHDNIYLIKTSKWMELSENLSGTKICEVAVNAEGILDKEYKKECETMKKDHDRRKKIDKDMEEEQKRKEDISSLEYYCQKWYTLIKNKAELEFYKERIKSLEENVNTNKEELMERYNINPQYEDEWLTYLQKVLPERKEQDLLDDIMKGYDLLKPEVFPE